MVLIMILQPHAVLWHKKQAYKTGETIRCFCPADCPLETLAAQLGLAKPRLVCHGVQLDLNRSLEQQNCRTRDTIFLLEEPPANSCSEWARCGRCQQGSRCQHAQSHTIKLSPRYIEHQAKSPNSSASSSPLGTPDRSASPERDQSPPKEIISKKRKGKERKQQEKQKQEQRVCRHWVSTGRCRYGDACHYAHPAVHPIEPVQASPAQPMQPIAPVHVQPETKVNAGWELWISSGQWASPHPQLQSQQVNEPYTGLSLGSTQLLWPASSTQHQFAWPESIIGAVAAVSVC